MFYTGKEKVRLETKFLELQNQVLHLFQRIESLEKAAHGLKKDGTPRAKPGRKPADKGDWE